MAVKETCREGWNDTVFKVAKDPFPLIAVSPFIFHREFI